MRIPTRQPRRPVMSLTPLIDVVFILLLFFMLASSFVEWSSFPLAATGDRQSTAVDDAPQLIIALDSSGGLRYDGIALTESDVRRVVSAALHDRPRPRFVVRADAEVTVRRIVEILDLLSQAGVTDAALQRTAG